MPAIVSRAVILRALSVRGAVLLRLFGIELRNNRGEIVPNITNADERWRRRKGSDFLSGFDAV
jgi:hypothetical protein